MGPVPCVPRLTCRQLAAAGLDAAALRGLDQEFQS